MPPAKKPGEVISVGVVGSRSITDEKKVGAAVAKLTLLLQSKNKLLTRVHSGGARGVDKCARTHANKVGLGGTDFLPEQPRAKYYFARNQKIVDASDVLLAVWDGVSRGTQDTIRRAHKKGIPVYVCQDMDTLEIKLHKN